MMADVVGDDSDGHQEENEFEPSKFYNFPSFHGFEGIKIILNYFFM